MTPKQMYKVIRKYEIAVWPFGAFWFAGETEQLIAADGLFEVNARSPIEGRVHRGSNPEEAVEDYCNARNLEWDI